MNKLKFTFVFFFSLIIIQSCKQNGNSAGQQESLGSGRATFAADDSFQPIVDAEADVFKFSNPQAKVSILYRTENDVLRLLLNDSVRMVMLSRELNGSEKKVLATQKLVPEVNRFAFDAIALIVNQASGDTLITIGELKKIFSGETKTDKNIVFDNPNSSLVRQLKSYLNVNDIRQKNIYSLKNSAEVIKYISQNQNAIGIVGYNWLDESAKDYGDAVKKVKIMSVKDEKSKTGGGKYYTPSQTTFALNQYPLMRSLYVINCTGKLGVGTGFAHFMVGERGQRIVLLSNLWPDNVPQREIQIKHKY